MPTPPDELATGWDLGGAHLKAAQSDAAGRLHQAIQIPCTLWRGFDHLVHAIGDAQRRLAPTSRHGITMTGELTDLFLSRAEGVERLVRGMQDALAGADLRIYAGEAGFVPPDAAARHVRDIASANWHASAHFVAERLGAGLFVDIGSTTTDVIPFAAHRVRAAGFTDEERLISEELVYTGVTRTPVMAIAEAVPFGGTRQRLMAEHFATIADVHRLTGALPADADQHDTADGRPKTPEDSARRLARMLGRDADSADMGAWRRLARHLSERQLQTIQAAAERALSRGLMSDDAPIVGAGVGRFLAEMLAGRLERPYIDFAALVSGPREVCGWAACCAPAAAIAALTAAEPD
jgi:probable H4MPT-linked C1 transfer pathway protein